MVLGNDGVTEFKVIWDIDMTLIGEDTCIIPPVKQVGAEGRRDFSRHGLKSSEDYGIRGRGSC